jgi:hypothetical protein
MATIVTRSGKGSALTHTEMDANFTNINTEVGTKGTVSNLSDLSITATDSEIDVLDMSGSGSTSGQILTSTGTGSVPTWQDSAAGGKVLQVLVGEESTSTTIATTTYTDVGLSVTITPSSASSKILLQWNSESELANVRGYSTRLVRNSTSVYTSSTSLYDMYSGVSNIYVRGNWIHLDSPNTTSAITYKIQMATYSGSSVDFNTANSSTQILAMEIGA